MRTQHAPYSISIAGAAALCLALAPALLAAEYGPAGAADVPLVKFVRLEKPGPDLTLAEVEVFAGGRNVAATGCRQTSPDRRRRIRRCSRPRNRP